ncbi:MAG TPA: AI-2E family transporter [Terracidiphilus sp.]|nr:AI-2E family transporter [Terracidiphilus sp.]
MNPTSTARILMQLWFIAVAVLAITVLYLGKVLLLPLGFAILFAFLLAPVVAGLERLRLPRPIAAMAVILVFAGLLCVATWSLFTQLVAITNDLPTYGGNIAQKMQTLHSPSNSAYSRAQREIQQISEELGIANSTGAIPPPGQADANPIGTTPEHPVQVRVVGRPTGRLDQLGGIIEPATTALLAVVFTFFVLLQREDLRNRLIHLSGNRNLSRMTQAMSDASRRISRYFLLQVAVNIVYGAIVCAALYFIGLPHAILFAALALICRFVPYVGAPIAALTPTLLSLAVFPGWTHTALIFGLFVVLEIVTANYVEPRVYGHHTGLSSLAVLIAAAFWTLIWGPVGLILSVPLTVCLVVMGSHIPALEFLAVLLGDQPVIPPYTAFYQRMLAHDEREASDILQNSLKSESLAAVYDSILIPALTLVEMERQKGELEEATVRFIRTSTSEMVDELGFRALEEKNELAHSASDAASAVPTSLVPGPSGSSSVPPSLIPGPSVLVIPVRDGSDDLISTMLTQVLDQAGFHSTCMPIQRIDETVSAVAEQKPDLVFLSGMPPVAMARANRIFRSLRSANPALKIIMGIWHYNEDPTRAAQMISRTEDLHISTSLADAIAEAHAHTEPHPAVEDPLDNSPHLVTTPTDTAA